jgi:hypothetical protein
MLGLLPLHPCHRPRHRERQHRLWSLPVSPCSGSPSQHYHLHNAQSWVDGVAHLHQMGVMICYWLWLITVLGVLHAVFIVASHMVRPPQIFSLWLGLWWSLLFISLGVLHILAWVVACMDGQPSGMCRAIKQGLICWLSRSFGPCSPVRHSLTPSFCTSFIPTLDSTICVEKSMAVVDLDN